MYSEPCVAASTPMDSLAAKVKAFVIVASLKAHGGLTLVEFGELFLALMRLAIETVDTLDTAGPLKKEMVLEALGHLFDEVADKAVPIWFWPFWVIAKPAVRASLLAAASGAIEVVLQLVRKNS
jgi:hypothetical protein